MSSKACAQYTRLRFAVRTGLVPSHAGQELLMQFPNHANAKRQFFEPNNAVFQSDNVIASELLIRRTVFDRCGK